MNFLNLRAAGLVLTMIVFTLIPQISTAQNEKSSAGKVAVVNGSEISDKTFEFELNQVKERFTQQGITLSEDQLKEVQTKTLNNLINQELLYQDSQKKGIKVENALVDERLAGIRQRFPSEDAFAEALKDINLTESELKAKISRGLAIEELIDTQITSKITVTDQENKSFYDEHPEFFKQPEQVKASHILIKVDPKADEDQKALAKQKIKTIQQKLKNGEDFGALAKQYSEGPTSVKDGDLGYFSRGQMVKPFEDAAFAMNPGEISDIVETQFGYHLIKVTEKKPATTIDREEVKEKITQHLKREKSNTELESYLEGLKSSAKIETFL